MFADFDAVVLFTWVCLLRFDCLYLVGCVLAGSCGCLLFVLICVCLIALFWLPCVNEFCCLLLCAYLLL